MEGCDIVRAFECVLGFSGEQINSGGTPEPAGGGGRRAVEKGGVKVEVERLVVEAGALGDDCGIFLPARVLVEKTLQCCRRRLGQNEFRLDEHRRVVGVGGELRGLADHLLRAPARDHRAKPSLLGRRTVGIAPRLRLDERKNRERGLRVRASAQAQEEVGIGAADPRGRRLREIEPRALGIPERGGLRDLRDGCGSEEFLARGIFAELDLRDLRFRDRDRCERGGRARRGRQGDFEPEDFSLGGDASGPLVAVAQEDHILRVQERDQQKQEHRGHSHFCDPSRLPRRLRAASASGRVARSSFFASSA